MRIIKIVGLFISLTLLFITCNDDVEVQNGLKDAPKLTFTKLTVNKQDVTKEQLLQQIQGKEKEGFSIKKITISDSAFAEVQGTAPNFSLKIKRAGTFTITITLQKEGFKEVTIEATIVYVGTESLKQLVFKRLVISSKYVIKEADILKRIPEKDRAGYTLKALKGLREIKGGPGIAKINGLSIIINRPVGIFTVDLVLQHPNYLDTTITGATFEKKDHVYVFDEKTGTISGVMKKYITYFKTATKVTFPDQINGVDVMEIKGESGKSSARNVFDNSISSSSTNSSIKTIYLPKNLKTIGDMAFYKCSNLTSIKLPDKVTRIGFGAFYGCDSLASITIPDKVTSIGESAFAFCRNLKFVTLPDALTSIEEGAFGHCSSLMLITLPDKVTSVGRGAFYGCNSLTSVTLPDALTSIGDMAFYKCSNLASITIPDKITKIEEETFSGCTSLTSIKLPDALTSIGDSAFKSCSNLTSIKLPDALTSIGDSAFKSCSNLTSIKLPDKVTRIGRNAFAGCTNLIVTLEQTDPAKITLVKNYYSYDQFDDVKQIKVPIASRATYKKANIWKNWASKIWWY